MPNKTRTVPVILIDGLIASGSSVISNNLGNSYSFSVINGNQYLRDLGRTTGYVRANNGTLEHELQLLDFYLYIAEKGVDVHNQIFSFLSSKISIAKKPTVVRSTGFASYALQNKLPIKKTYWLEANVDDRIERLLTRHKIVADPSQRSKIRQRLHRLDSLWERQLKNHMGIDMRGLEKDKDKVINTANMNVEQAFQKLATMDSFIDAYNSFEELLPRYETEWRRWHCLNCELVLETNKVVTQCPRCNNNDPNRFRDTD